MQGQVSSYNKVNSLNKLANKMLSMLKKNGFSLFPFSIIFLLVGFSEVLYSQSTPFPPPRQIEVFATQPLSFGDFFTGSSGGTVIVSPSGARTATGTVMLASGFGEQAIFEVSLLPGRQVSIMLGPTAVLTRVGGSEQMTVTIGPTDKGTSFVTNAGHPFRNPVQVGGTLNVGSMASNPAGQYVGFITVTFIQE